MRDTITSQSSTNDPIVDEYRASMDGLRFSDEAKARMAERLAQAAEGSHAADVIPIATSRRRRRLPLAAAAAGLAVALGLGGIAYASGALVSVQDFVAQEFGGSTAKVEIVDQVGRPVGVAQSSNGVTVSADAIIGDRTNVAIVFSISKDDGTPFEGVEPLENGCIPMMSTGDLDISLPPFSSWGATGGAYFYDADPSDNSIQLVETRSFDVDGDEDFSLVGRTVTARFSGFALFDEDMEQLPVAEGSWRLSFPLTYEDASVELPAGQVFDLDGTDATIDSLTISPIALHVSYTASEHVEWVDAPSGKEPEENSRLTDHLLSANIELVMTDGSSVELEGTGGAIRPDGDVTHCESGVFFDRIVDLDDVAAVSINGVVIEVR